MKNPRPKLLTTLRKKKCEKFTEEVQVQLFIL